MASEPKDQLIAAGKLCGRNPSGIVRIAPCATPKTLVLAPPLPQRIITWGILRVWRGIWRASYGASGSVALWQRLWLPGPIHYSNLARRCHGPGYFLLTTEAGHPARGNTLHPGMN